MGSDVGFPYCRTVGENGLPCWKVFDCWWEIFDVVADFKCRLDPETFERIANTQPKPKITSLLELVEQAKKRVAEDPVTRSEARRKCKPNRDVHQAHENTHQSNEQ